MKKESVTKVDLLPGVKTTPSGEVEVFADNNKATAISSLELTVFGASLS